LEVIIDILNPRPRIGVVYKFLLNPKMRFYFQVIILEFSSHHKTGNTRNYGCTDAPSQQQLCVAHQQSKIDYLEYPPTSLACKE